MGLANIGGLQLDFLPRDTDKTQGFEASEDKTQAVVRAVVRMVTMGWPNAEARSAIQFDWTFICHAIQAIFIERDSAVIRKMREIFQEGFGYIYEQLQSKNLTARQQAQAQLYISNCLSLLPFADFNPYEFITIPQYIEGAWQQVDYKVVPIELTPTEGIEKLFFREEDRAFAYGLEPIACDKAEPHLIFSGTSYPAGQGYSMQVHTDLEGFETAGKKLYRTGHERITAFLDKQLSQNKKTHVCGVSLGGALSLLVAIDQGNKLSRVDALNPAGLYESFKKSQYDHWDEIVSAGDAPEVFVQRQGRDPVSLFGVWKPEWHVLQVDPPQDKQGPSCFLDHVLNYAGFSDTTFTDISKKEMSQARKQRNTWIYAGLRGFIYYAFIFTNLLLYQSAFKFYLEARNRNIIDGLTFGACTLRCFAGICCFDGYCDSGFNFLCIYRKY